MASYLSKSRGGLEILALVMAGWIAALPTPAQSDPSVPDCVVLDRKTASGLLVDQVKPEYPPVAKVNYIQGQVHLQVVVSPDGRVRAVHVVRGHPFLAASALKAISRWVYRPFVRRSVPTAFQTFVDVNFQLRPKKLEDLPLRPDRDLMRRVHPPEILDRPSVPQATASVRLRILLSDKGRVIDSLPVGGPPAQYETARKDVERWTFHPARWGALAVPWYLDVDVPVEGSPLEQSAGDPAGTPNPGQPQPAAHASDP